MSLLVDKSTTDTTTSKVGFLTGLRQDTVLTTSKVSKSTTAAGLAVATNSFKLVYTSDTSENFFDSVTTDASSDGSLASSTALGSLTRLELSGSSGEAASSTAASVSSSSSAAGSAQMYNAKTSKKLLLLVTSTVGLSFVLSVL